MAGLGKLPGRLVSGAGKLLSGGYETPEEEEYETIDPRRAYWRGLSRDIGRAVSGARYGDFANRTAMAAEAYNQTGPERLRKQQEETRRQAAADRQAKMAAIQNQLETLNLRKQQTDYAQGRIDRVRNEHAWEKSGAKAAGVPLESFLKQTGHTPSQLADKIVDFNGVPAIWSNGMLLDPITRQPFTEETLATRAKQVGTAGGTIQSQEDIAGATTAAELGLGEATAKAEHTLGLIDQVLEDPDFDSMYGLKSPWAMPGGARADLEAIREQVGGQAFLEAFERLKGGGQITEREGAAATNAMTRIMQTNTSPEAAREAWKELRDIVKSGLARQERRAQGDHSPTISEDLRAKARAAGVDI